MNDALPQQGRLAGVDYGDVRIGIAISDARQAIASPLVMHQNSGPEANRQFFTKLVQEEDVVGFVVGLPLYGDGGESESSMKARRFGKTLGETTGLPVVFSDERYSSAVAEVALQSAGLTNKARKKRRDMLAAQVILAGYLESQRRQNSDPGSLEDWK